jgi:DNA-binding CsgD family transcriptional regulator
VNEAAISFARSRRKQAKYARFGLQPGTLTASEVRVLQSIVGTTGVAAVADARGISEPTVRTHLQRVFAKTDTKRQADLVKLVASYTSPFETRARSA